MSILKSHLKENTKMIFKNLLKEYHQYVDYDRDEDADDAFNNVFR